MSVYELGMTEEEYYRSSPRQINILINLNRKHRLGILYEVASDILSPAAQKEEEVVEIDSFTEIF